MYSAGVGAISLGVLTLAGGIGTVGGKGPAAFVHTSVALCILWSLVALGVARPRGDRSSRRGELLEVLQIAALITGLLAGLVLVYAAILEILHRTISLHYEIPARVDIWQSGILDLAGLAFACVLNWKRNAHGSLWTATFWIAVLAALWSSFRIPGIRVVGGGAGYVVPSDWPSFFASGAAAVIGLFALIEGILRHRRRVRAWPDALQHLCTPEPAWPGFDLSAGIISVLTLAVGCAYVILPWTAAGALIASIGLLSLVHRRWNENIADAALALMTLAVVSLCMVGFARPVWSGHGYAAILNRAILGLAVMTFIWGWLTRVWAQQLDDGKPWTTAGRLIRTARRVGFLIACLGVLLSLHLSFWPNHPDVIDTDRSTSRWVWGYVANGLLLLSLLAMMRGTRRSTVGWLVLLVIASMIIFALVRSPDGPVGQWLALHWPVAMALSAGVLLLLARILASRPGWRAMLESLVYTGFLIAPMIAVAGVTMSGAALEERMPRWVHPATFAILALVYTIAALYPGPSTFMTVSALCAAIALWHTRTAFAASYLPMPWFYGILSGLCLVLIGLAYRRSARPAFVRGLIGLGGFLLIVSAVASATIAR